MNCEPGDVGVPIVLRINTRHCLNLAAAVNVVLYDRAMKESARYLEFLPDALPEGQVA